MARGGARANSGPKGKPTEDHVREGTYRRDKHGPKGGVRPADGKRPRQPAGLSVSAKNAWKALLDDLQASALLDSADAPLYEAFAVNIGRAREARRLIAKHGMLVPGAREGQLVANPMLRVEREALAQARMLAAELAIGMRARASLGIAIVRGANLRGGSEDTPAADKTGIGPSPRLTALRGGKPS